MKKEDLFEGFADLDDQLLRRSEEGGFNMSWKKIVKWGSMAACFVIILGTGIHFFNDKEMYSSTQQNVADKSIEPKKTIVEKDKQEKKYVNTESLLAPDGLIQKETLEISDIQIGKYHALYTKVVSNDEKILKSSIGDPAEGTDKWFRVSGHEDLQYLIHINKKDEYSLWSFAYFQSKEYPYNDVLQKIYNIYSSDDIEKIISNPANMDNTDEGKRIQDEIGTTVITDKKDIEKIYKILTGLTCYGSDNWNRIGLGDDSETAMQEYVRMGRYLSLETAEGNSIDSLKYAGISGMFYEYNGVAYHKLKEKDRKIIEKILGIHK
ncbi:MAG: hypothetical protein HFJ09_13430 [Lachnospiraceae bacterium]|nr:hypothetical protein [Lachnospiraceae bacterium]